MSRKFNSVFKSKHDDMLKSLRSTLMLMVAPIASWAIYLRTGMAVSYYLTMILLIPAAVFFWTFLRDTGRVIIYYKFYSPYGEDTPHAQGKKKLSKRQRQKLKAKEAEVQ
jgi:hypothetical protein